MPTTPVTPQTMKGNYDAVASNGLDITFANSAAASGVDWVANPGDVVLLNNTTATGETATIISTPILGRVKDITSYALAAGEMAAFHFGKLEGWADGSTGKIRINTSDAGVKIAVLRRA